MPFNAYLHGLVWCYQSWTRPEKSLFNNRLHASNLTIFEHDLDAVRMDGTACQYACDDAFGQFAAALILFFDDLHAQPDLNLITLGNRHISNRLCGVRVSERFRDVRDQTFAICHLHRFILLSVQPHPRDAPAARERDSSSPPRRQASPCTDRTSYLHI